MAEYCPKEMGEYTCTCPPSATCSSSLDAVSAAVFRACVCSTVLDQNSCSTEICSSISTLCHQSGHGRCACRSAGIRVWECAPLAATSRGLAWGADTALARYLVCLQSVGQVGVWLTKPEVCLCPVMAEDAGRVPEQHLPQRLGMEGMERCRVQLLQDPQPRSKTPGTHP